MGGTPYRINDQSVTSDQFQFFLEQLKTAGVDATKAASDQDITAKELRDLFDANGDKKLSAADFRGFSATKFQDLKKVLDKHGFKLREEIEGYEALQVGVYGEAVLNEDGACCFGRQDRPPIAPPDEPNPDPQPGARFVKGSGKKAPERLDYYEAWNQTMPGRGTALKLQHMAERRMEAAGGHGNQLFTYDSMEVQFSISYDGVGVSVDPYKQTVSLSYNGTVKTYPLSGKGGVKIDFTNGTVDPSLGGKIGQASFELKEDGVHLEVNGIGVVLGYDGTIKGAKMEPKLALGPIFIQAKDGGKVVIGAEASMSAGKLKIGAHVKVHGHTSQEAWQGLIIDGVDGAFEIVNGQGLIRPLQDALDPNR